ncbi:MAG: hypothetical protein IJQ02_06610 [Oscillospiraceae bacterium]|nr:hypothetical protein [Oscillospiraceae bacterium]
MYQLSDNSIFTMMYKTTMEAQKGMYALYFKKNGLKDAREFMTAAAAATGKLPAGFCFHPWKASSPARHRCFHKRPYRLPKKHLGICCDKLRPCAFSLLFRLDSPATV